MTNQRSPQPERKRRPKHPARRTRIGLGVGAAVTTLGLTGAYWMTGVQASTSAAGTNSSSNGTSASSRSSDDSSSSTSDDDFYEDDDDGSSYSTPSVNVAPSSSAPDTSSRAS